MKHVIMFSGGIGSWGAAKRVAEKYGTDNLTLLFADTNIEDPDLYRFLTEAAANVGGELVRLDNDGRTPWDVFKDENFLGNSRIASCSRKLKQEPARAWLRDNCDPAETTVYVGIDWTESNRLKGARFGYAHKLSGCSKPKLCKSLFDREGKRVPGPGCRKLLERGWHIEAPLCEEPLISKKDLFDKLADEGIELPLLYKKGMPHNNCGGGCVKAGQSHFKHLMKVLPERFNEWACNEQQIRDHIGKDVAILRTRKGGVSKPLPLFELAKSTDIPPDEWGGCGCSTVM